MAIKVDIFYIVVLFWQYGVSCHPMAGSSGFQCSSGHAAWGNAACIAPLKWPATEVHLLVTIIFLHDTTHSKGPCNGPLKLMPSRNINPEGFISLFISYWLPPLTMDAVSATIVAGRRARL
jgi:hypothetical protein